MLTEALLKARLADLEDTYVNYLIERFGKWEVWAEASRRVANREEVKEEEIPEAFHYELRMMRVLLTGTTPVCVNSLRRLPRSRSTCFSAG